MGGPIVGERDRHLLGDAPFGGLGAVAPHRHGPRGRRMSAGHHGAADQITPAAHASTTRRGADVRQHPIGRAGPRVLVLTACMTDRDRAQASRAALSRHAPKRPAGHELRDRRHGEGAARRALEDPAVTTALAGGGAADERRLPARHHGEHPPRRRPGGYRGLRRLCAGLGWKALFDGMSWRMPRSWCWQTARATCRRAWRVSAAPCCTPRTRAVRALGHSAVCVLNSDSPTLPTACLVQAAQIPGSRVRASCWARPMMAATTCSA